MNEQEKKAEIHRNGVRLTNAKKSIDDAIGELNKISGDLPKDFARHLENKIRELINDWHAINTLHQEYNNSDGIKQVVFEHYQNESTGPK